MGKFLGFWWLCFLLILCCCCSGELFAGEGGGGGGGTEFTFETLMLNGLKLLGDSHWSNGSLRLTRDLAVPNSGAGRALYSKPVRFRRPESQNLVSFSTLFSFSVTNLNPSSIGGGIAFVISPDDQVVGDAGGYMGLMVPTEDPEGVVAVEFDTLMDVAFDDINGNHVGLDLNSMISSQVGDLDTVGVDLKSGNQINSWIDYSGITQIFNISVSYSNLKPKEPLLSFKLDLNPYLSDFMFVGFSGSTQGSTEVHSIQWWGFSSSFEEALNQDSSSPPPPPPPHPTSMMNPVDSVSHTPPPTPSPAASTNGTISHTKGDNKCHDQLCKRGPGAVLGVVTAGAFFLALCAGLIMIWVYTKKLKRIKKSDYLGSEIIKMPKEFTYKELKLATKSFDSTRIIGHGAFGTVYRGVLQDSGENVAVKRCSHNGQGKTEFLSELSIIGSLRHRNLVRLQGWCHEKGEILLIYDLMSNGSLDKALFESRMILPWQTRRKILAGVASAIAYLHQECENQVIHRDVKTSNIMLDSSFNGKLSDFGLARQIEHDKSPDATVAAGTMGYLAPEYLLTGRATEKTDVFSFGAVVLEVATGRRPIEKETNGRGINLVDHVWGLHREGRLLTAADAKLNCEYDENEMRRVLLVGLACSHPDPMARPTMRTVVQMLGGESEIPMVPRSKPSMSFSTSDLLLSLQDSVSDINGLITISTSPSDRSFGAIDELV